jgi:opacity protein-like surface antigen
VIIKAEYSYRMTGNINPALIVTPYPVGQPFYAAQHSVNIGVGYSF